jgi:tRNA(Ile)-lysidine synthase
MMLIEDLTLAVLKHLGALEGRFVLAVSGGRDSMALLHAVVHHLPQAKTNACAATFNHGIRPEAAAEVAFVQSWCAQHGVACLVGHADAPAQSARGISSESAARDLRYAFLAQAAQTWGASLIVTAHHADDQAETVLMHAVRGASLHGLVGMRERSPHPQQPALTLLRPLLRVPQHVIADYVAKHRVPFVEDTSNHDLRYTRNTLRHAVMPYLRRINPRVLEALWRLGQMADEDLQIVEAAFEREVLPSVVITSTSWRMPLERLLELPIAFQRRFVHRAHQALSGVSASFEDVQRALNWFERGQASSGLRLSGGVSVRVSQIEGRLWALVGQLPDVWWRLLPGQTAIVEIDQPVYIANGCLVLAQRSEVGTPIYIPRGARVVLRGRRRGDVFYAPGLRGHRVKLADWMIDRKLPREVRDDLPLLVVNDVIAAVLLPAPVVAYPFMRPNFDGQDCEALMIVLQ